MKKKRQIYVEFEFSFNTLSERGPGLCLESWRKLCRLAYVWDLGFYRTYSFYRLKVSFYWNSLFSTEKFSDFAVRFVYVSWTVRLMFLRNVLAFDYTRRDLIFDSRVKTVATVYKLDTEAGWKIRLCQSLTITVGSLWLDICFLFVICAVSSHTRELSCWGRY